MAVLKNFPMVSQLTSITSDGLPSENATFDCVAASIGAAILYYEGKSGWDSEINPDKLKDAAYGESYKGGTAASAYVAFCASLGYHLYAVSGTPGYLVTAAHQQLQAGHPVVFTEPDPYVSSSLGWSHVCVFYAEDSGTLTALDPYIAKPVKRTNAEWTNLLLFNQIWIIEKEVEELPKIIELTDPEVSRYFELAPDGISWRCRQTGNILQGAILAFYRSYGGNAACGLTYLGLPLSNERALIGGASNARRQYFERGVLAYESSVPHLVDSPPACGAVYLLKLYEGANGQDPMIAQLESQVNALKSQLSSNPSTDDAAKLAQIKAIVG